MTVGIVNVESKPNEFSFISKEPVRVGEYVVVQTNEGKVLALVEDSVITSQALSSVNSYESALEGSRLASKNPRDKKYVAFATVLGLLDSLISGTAKMPSLPAIPGTEVELASSEELENIFSRNGKEWVKVGNLLRNSSVSVSVNINKVASRHLAILAATGSGKSNLLALIAKHISRLGGTMIILDYHGEYSSLGVEGIVHLRPKINPKDLDFEEIADFLDIPQNATKQRAILAECLSDNVLDSKDFWDSLLSSLEKIASPSSDSISADQKSAAKRLVQIVKREKRRKGEIIESGIRSLLMQVEPDRVNVVELAELTDVQADIAISYLLDSVLEDRKEATRKTGREKEVWLKRPVVIAIEEAHTFIPAEDVPRRRTKEIIPKIAREGRKFGVSLIIVSQRPSKVDQDVLSQVGSLAVLRIIQPRDQSYIFETSEFVSEKIIRYLPSLNTGEAVLLGQWVVLPSVVQIEKVDEKLIGKDINAVQEWESAEKLGKLASESTSEEIEEF